MTYNPETGEVSDDGCTQCTLALQERLQAEVDLQAAERELRKARRQVTTLTNELRKQRLEGTDGLAAHAIFKYWVAACKKDESRTVLGDKRLKAITGSLRHHDPIYIARAIDGLAIGAYVNPETGQRYDDLELVCRDEVKLERFYNLAEQVNAPTLIGPAWRKKFGLPEPEKDDNVPF